MLDTGGPELQVVNKSEHPISLQADALVVLTPDQDKEATPNLLPINFSGLSKVISPRQKYVFSGSLLELHIQASYSITRIKVHFEVELTLIRRTVTVGGDFRLVCYSHHVSSQIGTSYFCPGKFKSVNPFLIISKQ